MLPEPSTPRFLPLAVPLVFVLLSISSIVYIEPAPYDIALLGLLVLFFAAGMRVPRELRLVLLLLGAFVLSNVIAAALAPDPVQSLRSLSIRTYMVLAWLFFVCLVVSEPARILPALWKGYLLAAVGAAIFGVLEYYGHISGVHWPAGMRAKGPFKDPNVFGPFLVPAALYCVSRLRQPGVMRRLVYGAILLLVVFGVLLSFSRGAWMNLAVSLALLVTFLLTTRRARSEKVRTALAAALVLGAAAAVVTAALSFTTAADRFRERAVVAMKYDVKEGGRFYTQRLAVERAGRAPLGLGPGRTDEEFGLEPHNLYLHVIVEGGWLAGMAFYTFIALTFTGAGTVLRWRSPLRDEFIVVFAATLGILTQSLFIDSTHWRHLWLMLALCWALEVAARRGAPVESITPARRTPRLPFARARRPAAGAWA